METPNFLVVTDPADFALVTALYRSSIDGRRWMAEAILDDDTKYNIPDYFTSRTAEILQVYLKSLGVAINTIYDEDDFIGEKQDKDIVIEMPVGNATIYCTIEESYYLKKLTKLYKKFMKHNPDTIYEGHEIWDYFDKNLPFKKKHLTKRIIDLFNDNIFNFTIEARKK